MKDKKPGVSVYIENMVIGALLVSLSVYIAGCRSIEAIEAAVASGILLGLLACVQDNKVKGG